MEELKKKIVFTVTNDLNYDQRMMRICTSLAGNGYDVLLVGRRLKKSTPPQPRIYRQKQLPCFFENGKLFYLEYNIRLFFFLLFCNADIYAAADTDTLLPNTLASKIKSRKLVYDAHEYFTEVPEVTNRKFVKSIWRRIETLCIPHAHLCYTVSQSLCEIFTQTYNRPFYLIRNVPYIPISSARVQPHDTKQKFTVLYQGDLNIGRGIEEIIEAVKDLDVVFLIAGDGPIRPEVERLIASQNIGSKVQLMGYVKPEELRKVTSAADVGMNVLANLGLSYYYSLSNKFFNYIQAGIPQICCDFPEYILINAEDEVALLTDLNPEHIRKAIQELMENKTLYHKLKTNCEAASKKYNWEKEEQLLLKLYHEL